MASCNTPHNLPATVTVDRTTHNFHFITALKSSLTCLMLHFAANKFKNHFFTSIQKLYIIHRATPCDLIQAWLNGDKSVLMSNQQSDNIAGSQCYQVSKNAATKRQNRSLNRDNINATVIHTSPFCRTFSNNGICAAVRLRIECSERS